MREPWAVTDGRRVQDDALNRAEQLAKLAAEQQDDTVQEVVSLLHILARVPEIRSNGGADCDALLSAVTEGYSKVTGIAVAEGHGVITCAANAAARGLSVADRPYFHRALASQSPTDVVLSELTVHRVTGRPGMFIAAPLLPRPGNDGQPGVILAGLDLGWFARLSEGIPSVRDQIVLVLDSRDGAVLARTPDHSGRVGQRYPGHPVLGALKIFPHGGSLVAKDLDGISRIFGFAPLPGHVTGLVVAIGLSEAAVRARADLRFWLSIAIALTAACLAMMTAWVIATRSVLRPISALVASAVQVGSGNLCIRVAMGRDAAQELRSLAASFTRMIRRLHARDARIAAMLHEIAASEEHHRLLADNVNDMIIRYSPDFRRLYVSPACRDLLGYTPEEMVGRYFGENIHPDDQQSLNEAVIQPLQAGVLVARAVFRAMHRDGRPIWLECSARRIEDGSGYVVATRDVSERKELEGQLEDANRRLRILAREDGLTRLANRRSFDEVLGEEYRRAMRVSSPLAVLMLDVDWFKAFNDSYGHPGGDACLQVVAGVMQSLVRRPADLTARYGGEEFVILLPDTDVAGGLAIAENIRAGVRDLAIPHAGPEFGFVTVSVGVAVMIPFVSPQGPANLVEAADAALYAAKRAGRNTVRAAGVWTATRAA